MRKKLRINHTSAITDLYILLSSVPENILFFLEQNERHPLAIYNMSKNRVISAFSDVIDALKNSGSYSDEIRNLNERISTLEHYLKNENLDIKEQEKFRKELEEKRQILKLTLQQRHEDIKSLLSRQKELLESMMAFIDDSYHIMKCFYPANSVKKDILFADKWMEEVEKKLIKEYKRQINVYRDRLALIVNKIKHNYARLNYIEFRTIHGVIKGYFVEGVDKNGIIGPDREIHKLFRNSDTAISLNFDLKYHLVNFIYLCHRLKVFLEKIIKKRHGLTVNINYDQNNEKDIEVTIIKSIQSLPYLLFPDEQYKPMPEIVLMEQGVEFIFPSNTVKTLYYDKGDVTFIFTADGVSKTYRLPYRN
jgi:hypothetical protein